MSDNDLTDVELDSRLRRVHHEIGARLESTVDVEQKLAELKAAQSAGAGQRAALWGVLARSVSECRECDRGPHDCRECARVLLRYADEILTDFVLPPAADDLAHDELVTLSQAVDRRLVLASAPQSAALVTLRRAQRRASWFPEPHVKRGPVWLYRVADLRRWEVDR